MSSLQLDLMEKMLNLNPLLRSRAEDLLHHEYFSDLGDGIKEKIANLAALDAESLKLFHENSNTKDE